jgi:hypothetical protein
MTPLSKPTSGVIQLQDRTCAMKPTFARSLILDVLLMAAFGRKPKQ